MELGTCRLCLQKKQLNREHVPPRSASNKTTKYSTRNYMDFLDDKDPFDTGLKGKVKQGGIQFHSYCEGCNNFLGTEYVRSYKNWVKTGASLINRQDFDGFHIEAHRQNPNRLIKEILAMFLAVNPKEFALSYPKLRKFLLDTKSTSLPENFRVFTYLNQGPALRYLKVMQKGNFKTKEIVSCSEITYPPFGYVLVIDNEKYTNNLLTEITAFAKQDPEKECTIEMKIHKLETHLPSLPLDYRKREEIETNKK